MNSRILVLSLVAFAAHLSAGAQTLTNVEWVGIWQADFDGLPTETLTLADDTGSLSGTVVLEMISREGAAPHVIASDPHVLMDPHLYGDALEFQVKLKRPDRSVVFASFTVTRTAIDKATIHCTNCGANAPVVELLRRPK
jgi:hypothetical protein